MSNDDVDPICRAMKKSATVLRDTGIPHALAGSLALWARGGPPVTHDVDFVILPQDVETALRAFERQGFRIERPLEEWLVKVWDGDVLVDLILNAPAGDTRRYIEDAEEMAVEGVRMPVMNVDDVMLMKLGAMNEHYMDYVWALSSARAVREQLTWDSIEREMKGSPFAEAFFTLCDGLGIRKPLTPS
jgi:hypothetical protein